MLLLSEIPLFCHQGLHHYVIEIRSPSYSEKSLKTQKDNENTKGLWISMELDNRDDGEWR